MKQKQTIAQAKNANALEKHLEENLPHITMKDKSEYRGRRIAITFICAEHGEYEATSDSIKKAKYGCRKCAAKSKQLPYIDFIIQAKEIHGEKYSYYPEKEAEWDGRMQKVKIFCLSCESDFWQTGKHHLEGQGCPVCAAKSKQFPYINFIAQAKTIHGEKYSYYPEKEAEWCGSSNKVKIYCLSCEANFWQTGNSHLNGSGCPVCAAKSKQLPYIDFIIQAKEIHGEKYSYYPEKEVEWKGSSNKVKIYCPTCQEDFWQTGYNHLQGQGCPRCNVGSGIDAEKNFLRNAELAESDCYLYYVKIADSYKIGISNNIAKRFTGQQYEILKSRKTTRLYAWRAEQMILDEFAEYKKYNPQLVSNGGTECFNVDISQFDDFDEMFNHNFTEPIN